MTISRPYRDETDLAHLIRFLAGLRTRNPLQRWHIGDLIWRMYYSSRFDPTRCVRLWENTEGDLVGFGWWYPPDGVELIPGDPALLPEMFAWAESVVQEGSLYFATLDTDVEETAYFESRGFRLTDAYGFHQQRRLDNDIPSAAMLPGFALRTVMGEGEAAARAGVHRLAFGSNNVTDEGYRNVMRAAQYQPELDLVAVAPDGRIAAFCLGWLDEANGVALFEPVGTHPDFRRQGLARAVMLEGMRRMRARGMESVRLATNADNPAGLALYRSVGFVPVSREVVYSR